MNQRLPSAKVDVIESGTYRRWIRGVRDRVAVARISARLRNVSLGNVGDVKPVSSGVFEIRVHYGPGYRIYCLRDGTTVVLLNGGDKRSQARDIERAGQLAKDWRQI